MSALFPVRLRTARSLAGLRQADLARLVDIDSSTLSLLESGKRMPSAEVLVALCKGLRVSADYLLGLDDALTGQVGTAYGRLNARDKQVVRGLIEVLARNPNGEGPAADLTAGDGPPYAPTPPHVRRRKDARPRPG